ncbi:hypothetical protein [Longivirga aurantiaca]|uniref:Lipoprotein n=1 Tax=Longivirga aurantiaca TaxID=1837743 RepID=A0ABW1SYP9_9ACTN
MSTATRRRTLTRAAGAAVLAVLLTACGNSLAGKALVVGGTSVDDAEIAELTEEVRDVYAAYPKDFAAVGASFDEGTVVSTNVNRLTRHLLLLEAAAREGITVTQGQIDTSIRTALENQFNGSQTLLDVTLAAQQQAPPSATSEVVYDFLVLQALAEKLKPADPATAPVNEYLVDLAAELGAEVSPRFGVWDAESISLTPVPDDLSVLPNLAPTE